jgi:UDP-N-acetyl-D-glucosamine dehydrogenase
MNSLATPRPDQAQPPVSDLIAAMANRRATIGVIGLGYVGLPLALTAAKAGFAVFGFDVDEARVRQINGGESFIKHIPAASIAAAISE